MISNFLSSATVHGFLKVKPWRNEVLGSDGPSPVQWAWWGHFRSRNWQREVAQRLSFASFSVYQGFAWERPLTVSPRFVFKFHARIQYLLTLSTCVNMFAGPRLALTKANSYRWSLTKQQDELCSEVKSWSQPTSIGIISSRPNSWPPAHLNFQVVFEGDFGAVYSAVLF